MIAACSGAIPWSVSVFPEADIQVSDEGLSVWVADDADERRRGLMEVERLPGDIDGMLFVYQVPASVSFGMFNTPMALDIWWFDANGLLIGTAEMEPCPQRPCTSYGSPGPIRWVLETPQGTYDFRPGDILSTVESG